MKRLTLFLALMTLPAPLAWSAAAEDGSVVRAQELPVDQPQTVQGVDVACTGMGETRLDPKWKVYPVRVEFSNSRHAYLTDAAVTLTTATGRPLLSVTCAAPWVLIKPAAGSYQVYAHLLNQPAERRSAPFKVPTKGQIRVVLQFPVD